MRATEGVDMTTTQTTATIAELLKKRRGDGYKSEAARTLGVSRQIYDTWETGHFIPGDEWAQSIATYLDRPLEEVVMRLYNDRAKKRDSDADQIDITWKEGDTASGEWFRRPIDVDAELARLLSGIGHPGWKAA